MNITTWISRSSASQRRAPADLFGAALMFAPTDISRVTRRKLVRAYLCERLLAVTLLGFMATGCEKPARHADDSPKVNATYQSRDSDDSTQSLPISIQRQLPPGYVVFAFAEGKINDDALDDYIVVLRRPNEEEYRFHEDAPARPLLIITQASDNTYSIVRRNDNVVFRINEGWQCDPFENGDIAIAKGFFTVEHEVACGQHWTVYITFRYVPKLKDWIFHKMTSENFVFNTSEDPEADALVSEGVQVVKANPKSPLLFARYRNE